MYGEAFLQGSNRTEITTKPFPEHGTHSRTSSCTAPPSVRLTLCYHQMRNHLTQQKRNDIKRNISLCLYPFKGLKLILHTGKRCVLQRQIQHIPQKIYGTTSEAVSSTLHERRNSLGPFYSYVASFGEGMLKEIIWSSWWGGCNSDDGYQRKASKEYARYAKRNGGAGEGFARGYRC